MLDGALYLASSFWVGALHAATPGHGKTVSAAYLVGTRGRPVDALALGVFVTLAHTSGIAVFAVLATLGSASLSQRSESYLSLFMAVLMLSIGLWMLASQWSRLPALHALAHAHGAAHTHSHSHQTERVLGADGRPSWGLLLGLGLAGGLLPDPAALAVLLAAIASGKVVLGLLTVLVFSLGFASVLVLVGTVVGRVGQAAVVWMNGRWLDKLHIATAGLIVLMGAVMTLGAWRQIASWA